MYGLTLGPPMRGTPYEAVTHLSTPSCRYAFGSSSGRPGRPAGTPSATGQSRFAASDLHATLLAFMGLDHQRLTFRHAGRDFRLTDVRCEVIQEIMA